MINTTELRLGNWVGHNNPNLAPKYLKVLSIAQDGINGWPDPDQPLIKIESGTLEPIPLIPEILEKCGYGFNLNAWIYADNENICTLVLSPSEEKNIWFYEYSGRRFIIKYLHQVQNLIFALTGEELKIQL